MFTCNQNNFLFRDFRVFKVQAKFEIFGKEDFTTVSKEIYIDGEDRVTNAKKQ